MPRDAFVLKIQRKLCHPKYARKVSGLSRNRPQTANGLFVCLMLGQKLEAWWLALKGGRTRNNKRAVFAGFCSTYGKTKSDLITCIPGSLRCLETGQHIHCLNHYLLGNLIGFDSSYPLNSNSQLLSICGLDRRDKSLVTHVWVSEWVSEWL